MVKSHLTACMNYSKLPDGHGARSEIQHTIRLPNHRFCFRTTASAFSRQCNHSNWLPRPKSTRCRTLIKGSDSQPYNIYIEVMNSFKGRCRPGPHAAHDVLPGGPSDDMASFSTGVELDKCRVWCVGFAGGIGCRDEADAVQWRWIRRCATIEAESVRPLLAS